MLVARASTTEVTDQLESEGAVYMLNMCIEQLVDFDTSDFTWQVTNSVLTQPVGIELYELHNPTASRELLTNLFDHTILLVDIIQPTTDALIHDRDCDRRGTHAYKTFWAPIKLISDRCLTPSAVDSD